VTNKNNEIYDSIFCIVNDIIKPYKKKNLNYLLNQHKEVVLFRDIKVSNKCSFCKDFKPWFIVKNEPRGLFLVKKIVEFFKPWITIYLQKTIYQFKEKKTDYDSLFILITKISKERQEKIYEFYKNYKRIFINQDIRIKNRCRKSDYNCEKSSLWAILKGDLSVYEKIEELNDVLKPWVIIKQQKVIHLHNIPQDILELYKWDKKLERTLGNLKVMI